MNVNTFFDRHFVVVLYSKRYTSRKGPFKCYVTQMGVGGLRFSVKKRYEGVRFNVISITRGWVGVQFPHKKRYVTLEWPKGRKNDCTRQQQPITDKLAHVHIPAFTLAADSTSLTAEAPPLAADTNLSAWSGTM